MPARISHKLVKRIFHTESLRALLPRIVSSETDHEWFSCEKSGNHCGQTNTHCILHKYKVRMSCFSIHLKTIGEMPNDWRQISYITKKYKVCADSAFWKLLRNQMRIRRRPPDSGG